MNWDALKELGVGGTFALLVLYIVFDFLNKRKTNGSTIKNGCVTRSEFEKHKDTVQYKDNCKQVQETIKTRFDGLEQLTKVKFQAVEGSLSEVKELIKNGHNH